MLPLRPLLSAALLLAAAPLAVADAPKQVVGKNYDLWPDGAPGAVGSTTPSSACGCAAAARWPGRSTRCSACSPGGTGWTAACPPTTVAASGRRFPGGDAVLARHFRVRVANANPPVAFRILLEAPVSAVFIRRFEMGQILKTHAGMTQNEQRIPQHRRQDAGFLALLHGLLRLL